VAASTLEQHNLSLFRIAAYLAVPVACVLVTIFVTWGALMRAYDLTHVPLFLVSLLPLGAAVAVGATAGTAPLDPARGHQLAALVLVVTLVAAGAIVEVVGHEIVGFKHTLGAAEDLRMRG
jgi:hypothetical protein